MHGGIRIVTTGCMATLLQLFSLARKANPIYECVQRMLTPSGMLNEFMLEARKNQLLFAAQSTVILREQCIARIN